MKPSHDCGHAYCSKADTENAAGSGKLRLVMGELQVADVRAQVVLSLFTDFENFTAFKPRPGHEAQVNAMFDQVIAWGGALRTVRQNRRRTTP